MLKNELGDVFPSKWNVSDATSNDEAVADWENMSDTIT
jgi:hypothetical protein